MEETGSLKCDNCNGGLPVRLKVEGRKCIITPCLYTTEYGGALCGTGCAVSYIKKHKFVKDVSNPNSGMYVQR